MIITISGTAGSGKSSIAKILAEKLGAQRLYVGGIRRELARKKGWTLEQLNKYAKTHPETDVDVDKEAADTAREMAEKGPVVVEGRTQFHFLPESFKVFVKVAPEEGARRIWKDLQDQKTKEERNEGEINTFGQLKREVARRDLEDAKRYVQYYGFDHRDEKYYDLVLDTTDLSIQEGVEIILTKIQQQFSGK